MYAEVYTKTHCPYCTQAKRLLDQKNIEYKEIDAVVQRETLIERVIQASGVPPKTVPQIFVSGEYVGGFTELEKWLDDVDGVVEHLNKSVNFKVSRETIVALKQVGIDAIAEIRAGIIKDMENHDKL